MKDKKERLGKKLNLRQHKGVNIALGSMNIINFKTIFIEFESYIQPAEDLTVDEYKNIFKKVNKNISNYVRFNDILNKNFRKESIVVEDIKFKAVNTTKKSYFFLELTLYVKFWFDFTNENFQLMIQEQAKNIIDEYFPFCEFTFTSTKF
jgi:hypothetical protein